MDDPALPADQHRHALDGLARINAWSRVTHALWPGLRDCAAALGRPVRVLDVACGGGDVTAALQNLADRRGLACCVDGCDLSERAVRWARERAQPRGQTTQRFFVHDAVDSAFPDEYDLVISSLFLHHLTNANAARVLRHMADASAYGLVVLDLRRGALPWALTWAGTRLITRSSVVHADGPESVAAGWSRSGLVALAQAARLGDVKIERAFPMKFRLTWRRA